MELKEELLKIINHYGIKPQLKYFQSEVFELNEAVLYKEEHEELEKLNPFTPIYKLSRSLSGNKQEDKKITHIAEEIADVEVMLNQIQYYYGISDQEIMKIKLEKVERQIKRIEEEE